MYDVCAMLKDILSVPLNEEILSAMTEELPVGIWINGKDGEILFASREAERQYGVVASELTGKNAQHLVDMGLASGQALIETLHTRQVSRTTSLTKIGKTVSISCYPFFDDIGEIFRVVGITKVIDDKNYETSEAIPAEMAEVHSSLDGNTEEDLSKPFIAESPQMKNILLSIERLGRSDATIMIRGESGVGKDGIAYRVHRFSRRSSYPYIVINCATIPENLIESELFGYEKGAFTSASSSKMGLFEMANHGTIFLDEVGDMPLAVQVKLLRCIQNRQILRVGGKKTINLDVRFITATNQPLEDMVQAGKFREDLYYRLNVVKIDIPPLRERFQDILPLSHFFLHKFNEKYELHKRFSKAVLRIFQTYKWPGNIRELENTVEHAVVMCPYAIISPQFIPEYINKAIQKEGVGNLPTLKEAVEACERQLLRNAMRLHPTSRQAAKVLGCDQATIIRKLKKYGLSFGRAEAEDSLKWQMVL